MELTTLLDMTTAEVAHEAALHLNATLERDFGKPMLLLLAGGSSLRLLEDIRAELLGAHLTIAMSDERFSEDPNVNNFAQLAATRFYMNAKDRGATFIDTRIQPGETVQALGRRFHETLHAWRAAHADGLVLMTQGVGADGHTCGMMPFPAEASKFHELFEVPEVWAIGYDAGGKSSFSLRVTVTMPFLREQVAESVAYAVGSDKQVALKKVMKKEGVLNEVPAFVMRLMKSVVVFTDQAI